MLWFNIKLFTNHFWAGVKFWLMPIGDEQVISTDFVRDIKDSLPCKTCEKPIVEIREYKFGDDQWVQEGTCSDHGKTRMRIETKSLLYDLRIFDNALKNTVSDDSSLTHDQLSLFLDREAKRQAVRSHKSRSRANWATAFFMLCLLLLALFDRDIINISNISLG